VQVALKDLTGLGQEPDRLQGAPERVVFARNRAPVLAYEILLSSLPDGSQASGAWRYWVDARTGEVIVRYNDVKDIAAPTSEGEYSVASGKILPGEGGGIEEVTDCWWDYTNNACYLYNKERKWFIYNDSDNLPDANTYAHRTSYDWGESDPVEMSGAMNFDATQTYFENVHGRNSYDNTNTYAHAN
jgi:Zn-dependent metalloprotease